jgi:GNAT superfamily N-acetyltransferase
MSSEVEDAARVSSTDALRFHLVAPGGTVDFAPTYTHQIFEDETIVGYDDPTVDVFCCASTLATFVRIEGDTAAAASSATAEEPAAPTDIMKCLVENDGLPQKGAIATRSAFDDAVRQSSAFVPPGERVGSFRARAPRWSSGGAQGSGGDAEYTIWRAQPGRCTAAERLQIDRLQTLALYLIDGSSYVDFESPAWTVYSAYCAGPGGGGGSGGAGGGGAVPSYCLAGYVTAHLFTQPFRPERPTSLKVCQVLVLPPYQRRGVASKMMEAVYADAQRANHFEVTVEDPAPAFTFLRDVLDFGRLGTAPRSDAALCGEKDGRARAAAAALISDARALDVMCDSRARGRGRDALVDAAAPLRRALHITLGQAARCIEMAALRELRARGVSDDTASAAEPAGAAADERAPVAAPAPGTAPAAAPPLAERHRFYRLAVKVGAHSFFFIFFFFLILFSLIVVRRESAACTNRRRTQRRSWGRRTRRCGRKCLRSSTPRVWRTTMP